MTTEQIVSIVAACIVSAGGIGGIIVAVVKFASEIIAKRLEEKYALKMSEALENHKAVLDSRTHISRALFDKEFEIYQSLCNVFYEAYSKFEILCGLEVHVTKIIPKSDICFDNPDLFDLKSKIDSGDAITEIAVAKLKKELCEKLLEFGELLNKSAAFIPYNNQKLFIDLYNGFRMYWDSKTGDNYNQLLVLRGKMQVELRKYLENISIIE